MFRHTIQEIQTAIAENRPLETANRIFRQRTIEYSVKDLRTIISTNPSHEDARVYYKATKDMDGDYKVTVDEVRIKAILENRESRLKATVVPMEEGGWVTVIDTVLITPEDLFGPPTMSTTLPPPNFEDALAAMEAISRKGTTPNPADHPFAAPEITAWEDHIDKYDAEDHPQ